MRQDCETTVTKCVKTKTPVRLRVVPEVGDADIECGTPRICFFSQPRCCRKSCCESRRDNCCERNSCEFVVEQILTVEIPIRYDVRADVGESFVDC